MYLAGPETRKLNSIDRMACRSDPRLAGMFATFTRLTMAEKMPPAERLSSPWRRLLAMLMVPLLIAVTLGTAAAAKAAAAACWVLAAGRRHSGMAVQQAPGAEVRSPAPRE